MIPGHKKLVYWAIIIGHKGVIELKGVPRYVYLADTCVYKDPSKVSYSIYLKWIFYKSYISCTLKVILGVFACNNQVDVFANGYIRLQWSFHLSEQ